MDILANDYTDPYEGWTPNKKLIELNRVNSRLEKLNNRLEYDSDILEPYEVDQIEQEIEDLEYRLLYLED